MSSTLGGEFFTTEPPGKPSTFILHWGKTDITSCKFHVYSIIFLFLYSLQSQHQKFSFHRSPYSWSSLVILAIPLCGPALFSESTCLFWFSFVYSFILDLFVCLLFRQRFQLTEYSGIKLHNLPQRAFHIYSEYIFEDLEATNWKESYDQPR